MISSVINHLYMQRSNPIIKIWSSLHIRQWSSSCIRRWSSPYVGIVEDLMIYLFSRDTRVMLRVGCGMVRSAVSKRS
ncbi:hypothetical protein MtrunA17_Chr4g0064891 [Medicago truncatula]|uniref:Uncharacterized protein n=1 Tax=Medicago truncatula TaxID=3880 RepID=A0A396IIA2_MEDTR|nr:hypothetical protein MtrunA17_Chr4g0064891 [Medicago truncatula]